VPLDISKIKISSHSNLTNCRFFITNTTKSAEDREVKEGEQLGSCMCGRCVGLTEDTITVEIRRETTKNIAKA
jgi:hypothetical protein